MRLSTRKLLDKAFSSLGIVTILLMAGALLIILVPIISKGSGAVFFRATTEHRRLMLEQFGRGDEQGIKQELEEVQEARKPVYAMFAEYEDEIASSLDSIVAIFEPISKRDDALGMRLRRRLQKFEEARHYKERFEQVESCYDRIAYSKHRDEYGAELAEVDIVLKEQEKRSDAFLDAKKAVKELLGPFPGEQTPVLLRRQYGQTRWDRAQISIDNILYYEVWDYSDSSSMGTKKKMPRSEVFRGTKLEPLFGYVEEHAEEMLNPRATFYGGFFIDPPKDSHIFGGVLPELLGTLYLTVGAMLFAFPLGVVAAIFFTEYAGDSMVVKLLRTCVSTLAGVPSIVFGLFGLAFFINAIHIPKSVLAGSLTLALLILPTIIRASEEAIRSVPKTYREAALALGAGKWHTIVTVILPAALPGILTGSVISMGRAAGETAPIIFTAAVSVGKALNPLEAFMQPTPALSWNIYNLTTEHEAVDQIRHVQFGMVATLILLVLLLNAIAVFIRAYISNRLRG